jgi:hypothetical protein
MVIRRAIRLSQRQETEMPTDPDAIEERAAHLRAQLEPSGCPCDACGGVSYPEPEEIQAAIVAALRATQREALEEAIEITATAAAEWRRLRETGMPGYNSAGDCEKVLRALAEREGR